MAAAVITAGNMVRPDDISSMLNNMVEDYSAQICVNPPLIEIRSRPLVDVGLKKLLEIPLEIDNIDHSL